MDISQYLDPKHPYFFYILGTAILLVYVAVSRRNLKNENESKFTNSDNASENEDTQIPKGMEHFTQLDKTMKWKTVLLVVLIIIGLYLVIFVRQ